MKKLKISGKNRERVAEQTAGPRQEAPTGRAAKSKEESNKPKQPPKELFWDDYSDLGYC